MSAVHPTAFISYAWDADTTPWVKQFATLLRTDGIDCKLDQWELAHGDQLAEFMDRSVRESDYVLIVCTPKYKIRSDGRIGGVGYEGDIMTAEVMNKKNHRKFIPILKAGRWEDSAATWLSGKLYVDLRGGLPSTNYQDLVRTIYGLNEEASPLGTGPSFRSATSREQLANRARRLQPVLRGATVLVVNDHISTMSPTIEILTDSGVSVQTATSKREAISLMQSTYFDAIISDMRRGTTPDEGQRFLLETRRLGIARPTIFSVYNFEPERGTPPYAFAIANYVNDIVNRTFDALEHERG